jgi:molecular chaperone DnaJ
VQIERDPYAVLGVTRAASEEEIQSAFQRLADGLHPDVVEAYEVLSHPRRRFRYDTFGFGTLRRRKAPPTGIPPIEISLKWYEAERGVSLPVEFEELVVCEACTGRGYEPGVAAPACERCGGTGHLSLASVSEEDEEHFLDMSMCLACEGRGLGPKPRCSTCSGMGTTVRERVVHLRVPPGLMDGNQLMVESVNRPFELRVGPRPRDSKIVLGLAVLALIAAVILLLYLLRH